METGIRIGVALLMFVCAYLLIVKKKVNILHSYHYKRVKDEDLGKLCVWSGIGVFLCGIGVILIPYIGERLGMICTGAGILMSLGAVCYYNKGLF